MKHINKSIAKTTHGLSKHPLYKIYFGIIKRCENPKCPQYRYYGGRGVRMCKEWKEDFTVFYTWCLENGWKEGMEIDKDIIAKEIGIPALVYSPEMCSIVTIRDNMNAMSTNIDLEHLGRKQTISQWAEEFKINYKLFWTRLNRGWNIEKALSNHRVTTQESGFTNRSILLNTNTGIYYFGFKEAAQSIGMKENTLYGIVQERRGRKNNTHFIIV